MMEDRRLLTVLAYDWDASTMHDQTLYASIYAMDMDGDVVTYSVDSGPTSGTLSLNTDGSYTYTPNANFVGSDSFGYSATDGIASSVATVTINVFNAAPEAYASWESVFHDEPLTSCVSGSDPDGDTLTFSVVTGPSNGTLNFNSDGSFDYTPNPSFVGNDSFDFNVSDGLAADSGMFTIDVYNSIPEPSTVRRKSEPIHFIRWRFRLRKPRS
ncbi:MAG: tandem-95 repeat protein [Planctomycetales bacterium]|nr:tandem-95 repeat protein [Planctomycetales bacterium]